MCGLIASTGHAVAHAPQSTHVSGSTCSISAVAKPGSPGAGRMQLTGQARTQEARLVTWSPETDGRPRRTG